MAKTKIVVLQMKELIYTAIFAGFLILLIVLLIIMFTPSGKKDKSSDASTGSLYQPGVYHSQVSLGDTTLNIELVTDSDQIKSVTLVNLESSVQTMYPHLYHSMETIEKELELTKCYLDIQRYRYPDFFQVEVVCEEDLKDCLVPKTMIQPLVENAVFHGLEQKIENGTVWVHVFSPDHATLCFVVEDDGCGIEPERLKQILASLEIEKNTTKIGVFNIYQRLKLYYDDKFSFDIKSSLKKGTCITISIPRESTAEPEGSIL